MSNKMGIMWTRESLINIWVCTTTTISNRANELLCGFADTSRPVPVDNIGVGGCAELWSRGWLYRLGYARNDIIIRWVCLLWCVSANDQTGRQQTEKVQQTKHRRVTQGEERREEIGMGSWTGHVRNIGERRRDLRSMDRRRRGGTHKRQNYIFARIDQVQFFGHFASLSSSLSSSFVSPGEDE